MTRIHHMTHRGVGVERHRRDPERKSLLDFKDKREEAMYVNQALAAAEKKWRREHRRLRPIGRAL